MLSERERHVFDLVVAGRSTKEIAHQLGLSPRTIEIHRGHILRKMGCRNSVELVRKSFTGAGATPDEAGQQSGRTLVLDTAPARPT